MMVDVGGIHCYLLLLRYIAVAVLLHLWPHTLHCLRQYSYWLITSPYFLCYHTTQPIPLLSSIHCTEVLYYVFH